MQLHVYVLRDGQFERLVSLQGHTDWIRSIQIMTYTNTHENTSSAQHFKDGDLVIASASQDRYIRLWSVSQALTDGLSTQNDVTSNSTFDMMEALSGMAIGQDGVKMSTKAHVIQMEDGETRSNYVFMLHALLMGHEDWVHSVHWQPARKIGSLYHQPLALISASADKSLMIWSPEADSESWTYATRFGEMGGTTLGFYGGQFSPDGSQIIAHGYHGALQLWTKAGGKTHWDLSFGISGHQNKVQDLAWDPTGQYLLTTSLDQTTRLIGQWSRDGSETTWHEMARPQIHGYDLNAVTFLNKYQFVSAADEKVLRVFDAPRGVIDMIHALAKEEEAVLQERPHCATLPALGLSNKAVYDDTASPSSEPVFHPPLEPTLLTQTLWPEKDKLYGHGYEIVSIASTHDGSYFVSASKASKPEHASVIVWSGETKRQVCKLAGHGLTVTAMAFSPDDKFLVTVSRDRGICLYEKTGLDKGIFLHCHCVLMMTDTSTEPYKLSALHNKAHARIIWDCAWTSTGSHFVTVSRDKSMKLWALTSQCEPKEMLIVKMDDAITSCDIAPCQSERLIMAALGLENGRVIVMTLKEAEDDIWKVESQISYPES